VVDRKNLPDYESLTRRARNTSEPVRGIYRKTVALSEHAVHQMRMNNVLPGWIDSLPAQEQRRQSVPMQRYGTSEEVAATIAFLASDAAAYITGQSLRIDGGLMRSV
jgi:NAD(P)-dependent dehydrogenase (short-subunit alcohol dehydrogenase family)